MEMITLLVAISAIEWYLIEKGKKELWGRYSFGKWITIGVSLVASFLLTFSFGLDLISAVGLVDEISIAGQILTAFALSSGSSALAEIMEILQKDKN